MDGCDEELKVFLDDTEEQIQILDESIIKLEKDPDNQSLLQHIFRAAHTIKGGSATLGQTKMAELTHHMESVFDAIRKGQLTVNSDIIDIVFDCLDVLRSLKDDIVNSTDSGVEVGDLIGRLKQVYSSSSDAGKKKGGTTAPCAAKDSNPIDDLYELVRSSEEVRKSIAAYQAEEKKIYAVSAGIVPACQMKSVRAFQIVNELASLGEVIVSIPSIEDIYQEKAQDTLVCIMSTGKEPGEIEAALKTVDEIEKACVTAYDSARLEPRAEPAQVERDAKGCGQDSKIVTKVGRTVRVDVERLDSLMNLVGELVIDRTRIYQLGSELTKKYEDDELTNEMTEAAIRIGRVTAELQEEIMKARMLPIGNVFSKFPRMVRDTAKKCGKKINFVIEGQATELDRSVIEEIGDPLIHILRNAVDHGIEDPETRQKTSKPTEGFVRLSAFHEENYIIIRVEDDGKGLDVARLKKKALDKGLLTEERIARLTEKEAMSLIFLSGISTADKISDVSGRGVGMDIVKNNIEKINGQISIDSVPGKGTTFSIKLPLTLAIIQALLINVNKRIFAIPLISVQETIQVEETEIQRIKNKEAIILRGHVLPLLRLKRIFYPDTKQQGEKRHFVVVVSMGDKQVGFMVDSLVGEQEIVIKNLNKYIGDVKGISGATILGDGRVALIIDVTSLINKIVSDHLTEG